MCYSDPYLSNFKSIVLKVITVKKIYLGRCFCKSVIARGKFTNNITFGGFSAGGLLADFLHELPLDDFFGPLQYLTIQTLYTSIYKHGSYRFL